MSCCCPPSSSVFFFFYLLGSAHALDLFGAQLLTHSIFFFFFFHAKVGAQQNYFQGSLLFSAKLIFGIALVRFSYCLKYWTFLLKSGHEGDGAQL